MLSPEEVSRLLRIMISRSILHTLFFTSNRIALPPFSIGVPSYSMALTQQSTTSLMPLIVTLPKSSRSKSSFGYPSGAMPW